MLIKLHYIFIFYLSKNVFYNKTLLFIYEIALFDCLNELTIINVQGIRQQTVLMYDRQEFGNYPREVSAGVPRVIPSGHFTASN